VNSVSAGSRTACGSSSSTTPDGLVDELLLVIHPPILGEGLRLFEHGEGNVHLLLNSGDAVDGGVIIAAYEQG
jgi:dihydrofolate reductase